MRVKCTGELRLIFYEFLGFSYILTKIFALETSRILDDLFVNSELIRLFFSSPFGALSIVFHLLQLHVNSFPSFCLVSTNT
jgi:hypothetical protein